MKRLMKKASYSQEEIISNLESLLEGGQLEFDEKDAFVSEMLNTYSDIIYSGNVFRSIKVNYNDAFYNINIEQYNETIPIKDLIKLCEPYIQKIKNYCSCAKSLDGVYAFLDDLSGGNGVSSTCIIKSNIDKGLDVEKLCTKFKNEFEEYEFISSFYVQEEVLAKIEDFEIIELIFEDEIFNKTDSILKDDFIKYLNEIFPDTDFNDDIEYTY